MIDLKRGFYILMANGSVKCRKGTRIKIIQKFLKVSQYPHLTDATKWIALSQYDWSPSLTVDTFLGRSYRQFLTCNTVSCEGLVSNIKYVSISSVIEIFMTCTLAKPVFSKEDLLFFELGVSCHFQEASQCFVSMGHTEETKINVNSFSTNRILWNHMFSKANVLFILCKKSKSLKMKLKMHDENVHGVTPDENTRRRVGERINN